MTVEKLIRLLAGYPPDVEVEVCIDHRNLPLKGHTTFGRGDTVTKVVLFSDTRVRLVVMGEQEHDALDEMRGATRFHEYRTAPTSEPCPCCHSPLTAGCAFCGICEACHVREVPYPLGACRPSPEPRS